MTAENNGKLLFGASSRIELVATIIMALAAIFTAWAAFQSAKWSGEQAIAFSKAGASRTESARYDAKAGAERNVDVTVFVGWLEAINADAAAGLVDLSPGVPYEPAPGSLSTFIFDRFRPEFKPAMDAWLTLWNEDRATAPPTPFAMDEYVLANAQKADEFLLEAQQHAEDALRFNQNADNYVLTVVAFALVLFFGGVSTKLESHRNRLITISLASLIFVGATVTIFSLPIHALP